LIGVVSYLLINFYFTRIQANKAATLALTVNRVGDMGLSIGFFAIFALFGSVDYSTIFSLAPFMNETAITIISLLLFTGAMAKSAQIPLHSWLVLSMEAESLHLKPKQTLIKLNQNILVISLLILIINFVIYSEKIFLSLNLLDYFYIVNDSFLLVL
jgi:NADH-ubiquinone oxidoreductase chain 5